MTKKVIVVGGGFAGVKAALDLSEDNRFDITLISDSPDFRYYPSLYHTATGGSSNVSSIPLADIFEDKPVNLKHSTVEKLDRAAKAVITQDGDQIDYDYLILAMGVVTNFFNIPGLPEFAYGIKTLEDAEELKKHLHKQLIDTRKPDLNYVIVGGGPTGIELAGVLGDYIRLICRKHGVKGRAVHVDLIEAAPRLLPRMPKRMSRKIARQLRRKGVKLYLKTAVQAQTADEIMVKGKPIRSHSVIWTAGVANNPFFGQQGFQLAGNGKVRTDQYLQAERDIFVAGDNADTPYSGMAQTALYDGVYIARNLIRLADGENPEPYRAKEPIYVMPAGPNWAAVLWGQVHLYGRIGWALRRAADWLAYNDYEPWMRATKRWFAEYDEEEFCAYCSPENNS